MTAIMELNPTQELASIYQCPLFLVLLYLRNAHDSVDRDFLIMTLEGYMAVPRLCGFLETFWFYQQVIPKHNGFHGPTFLTKRGTMQGGLVSKTIFNVLVENFIRIWLAMTVDDQRVDQNGMGETSGRCLGVFYANDDMMGSGDADRLHHSMNVLVSLFQRYCLLANVDKYRSMTCQPGTLRSGMSAEAKALKYKGVVYEYRMRLRRRIPYPECGVELTRGR